MTTRPRFLTLLTTAALTLTFVTSGSVAGKGKPTPPPPEPDPPLVTYAVKTFNMPATIDGHSGMQAYNMTSSGVVVGYYETRNPRTPRPFIYDASIDPDMAIDLNDVGVLVESPTSTVEEPLYEPLADQDWRIAFARDINEHGFVVGALEKISDPFDQGGVYRGYMLDLATKHLMILPDGPGHTYARAINDNMDILGVSSDNPPDGPFRAYLYNPLFDTGVNDLGLDAVERHLHLSNPAPGLPAQVVGEFYLGNVFRYIDGVGLDPTVAFQGNANDISPTGKFCGVQTVQLSKRRTANQAFRYATSLEPFSEMESAVAINGAGDFVSSSGLQLFHEGTGVINLSDSLVISAGDAEIWNDAWTIGSTDMTERGTINPAVEDFPGICGDSWGPSFGYRGFVLVPVTPPAP